IIINTSSTEDEDVQRVMDAAKSALEQFGEIPENEIEYNYISISGAFDGNTVTLDPTAMDIVSADVRYITFVPVQYYNNITGQNISLEKDKALIDCIKSDYGYDSITIKELGEAGSFNIVGKAEDFVIKGSSMASFASEIYLFVSDESVIEDIYKKQLEVYEESYVSKMHNYYGFDLKCDNEKQVKIFEDILFSLAQQQKDLADAGREYEWCGYRVESAVNDEADFFAIYGGLFFLGVVFGAVFICAAALIMYYKQISEGFEDKSKFGILQKVGMTKTEIRKSINSQVLTVFFMPLAAAGLHMVFAFPIVSRLLLIFGLNNTALFAVVTLCCFGAFSLVYTAVYFSTARSYYKMVSTDRA
ncbi:MAG: ABC transporter permease, partial [Oscillospiraceae bacterium]|nr:ABC transporter permease [Oscillospiraceae bacterium]